MSLAFQNNDCIKQALYEELQNVLNPNAEIRMAAEKRIKHLEFTEGYGVYLAECIMNQSFDLGIRQLASVMLKQYVVNHWCVENNEGTNLEATEQVKKIIKNILPNGLYDPNSKVKKINSIDFSVLIKINFIDKVCCCVYNIHNCIMGLAKQLGRTF